MWRWIWVTIFWATVDATSWSLAYTAFAVCPSWTSATTVSTLTWPECCYPSVAINRWRSWFWTRISPIWNRSMPPALLTLSFICYRCNSISIDYWSVLMLISFFQEEDCVIESLSLVDCKLKSELYSIINAVGSNLSLQHLDLKWVRLIFHFIGFFNVILTALFSSSSNSGNYMGDSGARLMSKALQVNTSLRTLSIDRNNISVHGYSDIAYALEW